MYSSFQLTYCYHRKSVASYEAFTALNHMQKMPGFDKGFHKFVYQRLQKEADVAARSFNEPGPRDFSRSDLKSFEADMYYEKLWSKAPLTMSSLGGICSKQKFQHIKVKQEQEQEQEQEHQ